MQPKAEQNVVRMKENTVLGIDKLTSLDTGADVVTETQLDLKAGRIFGSVKKMSRCLQIRNQAPQGRCRHPRHPGSTSPLRALLKCWMARWSSPTLKTTARS